MRVGKTKTVRNVSRKTCEHSTWKESKVSGRGQGASFWLEEQTLKRGGVKRDHVLKQRKAVWGFGDKKGIP